MGWPPGIGLHFGELSAAQQSRLELLLEDARTTQPRPAKKAAPPVAKPEKAEIDREKVIVGIDLGTSYTVISAHVGSEIQILSWPNGSKSIPSVVHVDRDGVPTIGNEARAKLATDPMHTVSSPKRLLGRDHADEEIAAWLGQAAYDTEHGPDGSVVVGLSGGKYAVTQLCSYLLAGARDAAEAALGVRVSQCVLTLPVSFPEDRVVVAKRAASLAHLDVVDVIDEPSAAALANRWDPNFRGIVGVFDFGGGTFDFSLVDVSKGDMLVLTTAGDTWLGGDDFDIALAEIVAKKFQEEHTIDLRQRVVEWTLLVKACETAKIALSNADEAVVHVSEICMGRGGMLDVSQTVTRREFEEAARPLVQRAIETCGNALSLSSYEPGELSAIFLTGGTSSIPMIKEMLEAEFGIPIQMSVDPNDVVCMGAGIHAWQLQRAQTTTLSQ